MTNLTPEQRVLGRENANRALGVSRRDLLKAAAATPALAGFYFGYKEMGNKSPVKAAIIGTGDEGCQAMIRSHNREYLDFIGFCDIRPSQQERAVKEFSNHKEYYRRPTSRSSSSTPARRRCTTTPTSRWS